MDGGDFRPQSGNGSFDFPQFSDGQHTLTYAIEPAVNAFPAFDYLTVTAGPNTPLEGKTLAVDDADTAVVYSGDWSTSSPIPASFDYSEKLYKNTAHWTNKVGSSLQFNFKGKHFNFLDVIFSWFRSILRCHRACHLCAHGTPSLALLSRVGLGEGAAGTERCPFPRRLLTLGISIRRWQSASSLWMDPH